MSAPHAPSAPADSTNVGIWIVGARGSVATTVAVGAAALAGKLASPTGCVTELPFFRDAELPHPTELVFGGHDMVGVPLTKRAAQLADAGVFPAHLLPQVEDALRAAEQEIRPGIGAVEEGGEGGQWATVSRLVADLASFRERNALEQVVVVNLASTEAPVEPRTAHRSLAELRAALESGGEVLPPSALYAYAAFEAGCGYVNFTPSAGASLPALDEFAREAGVPYAGRDGKTGETLVKTALAPMFLHRALRVRAWSGTNLLGGGDGATLADPDAARSKTETKARAVQDILGHPVEGLVHIDNVPEMTEWKTAWDHVLFEGFLGNRMTFQFTWQGCDSALAAPLVLDLVRLVAMARRRGETGLLPALGFFFKEPMGSREHDLTRQFDTLVAWATAAPGTEAGTESAAGGGADGGGPHPSAPGGAA
ncbi:inositol-3-phosphate synthase [Streptomyces bohaiensis]|uniref:Myo-inositol-1-phosphate synthase n=1 Tax=Streptomyces bohaiensis TaxID=1431344 RepID=A0ABX1CEM7_9ACTN|nr:inositol-3-phosphate synthase [Streptomyces bohaiensis]NJQ16781.1 myo-inositol-1-phosphate synthase [Streptomyces bohaiensis]